MRTKLRPRLPRTSLRRSWLLAGATAALMVVACAPANTRPLAGAVPGQDSFPTPTPPPTLAPPRALLAPTQPLPSPGVSQLASPSAEPALPPVVRTIQPPGGATLPTGQPATISAVLEARGAELANASLALDGKPLSARVTRSSAKLWTIAASSDLAAGSYTARVLVTDSHGGHGGFTWRFVVGSLTPTPSASATARPGTSTPAPNATHPAATAQAHTPAPPAVHPSAAPAEH